MMVRSGMTICRAHFGTLPTDYPPGQRWRILPVVEPPGKRRRKHVTNVDRCHAKIKANMPYKLGRRVFRTGNTRLKLRYLLLIPEPHCLTLAPELLDRHNPRAGILLQVPHNRTPISSQTERDAEGIKKCYRFGLITINLVLLSDFVYQSLLKIFCDIFQLNIISLVT